MGDMRQQPPPQFNQTTLHINTPSAAQAQLAPEKVSTNWSHFRSIPGILTMIELILAILVLICIGSSRHEPDGAGFIYFTSITGLIYAVVRLAAYFFAIPNQAPDVIAWMLVSMVVHTFFSVVYFISGCIAWAAVDYYRHRLWARNTYSCYGAAGFFCWVAWLLMLVRVFYFFVAHRNNEIEEGYGLPHKLLLKQQPATQTQTQEQAHQNSIFTRT